MFTSGKKKKSMPTVNRGAEDDVLAVLRDEKNGKEYYVSVIDVFEFQQREYSVMYNYRPNDGSHREPEIVCMRSYKGKNGEKFYSSIRGKRELEIVFEIFYERYRTAKTTE